MHPLTAETTEAEFARVVEEIKAEPGQRSELHGLLGESLDLYRGRGAAAMVRMRGWLLVAMAEVGVVPEALPFVLEELDNGRDAYLVAAAARALRSYPEPEAGFAPFLGRAITNIGLHDDAVSFDHYGAYAGQGSQTTALNEIVRAAAWLGPAAASILPQIQELAENRERIFPRDAVEAAATALATIQKPASCCCGGESSLPAAQLEGFRRWEHPDSDPAAVGDLAFEDHAGDEIRFDEYFRGQPTVVVFFYTRCGNPQRCSLTITKLARLQKRLDPRVRTAAITYDPTFDSAHRMHEYARGRGAILDAGHRMLRTTGAFDPLKEYFRLGVNFVESVVNRHRVELYVLDSTGRIFASFERVQWDERLVAETAAGLLDESGDDPGPSDPAGTHRRAGLAGKTLGVGIVSVATAFFPKCPVCWATFLGMFGVAGLRQIPYAPWLWPVCAGLLLTLLLSRWWRDRANGITFGLCCCATGMLLILASGLASLPHLVSFSGVVLNMIGTLSGNVLAMVHAPAHGRSLRLDSPEPYG